MISNVFGDGPLVLAAIHVAQAAGESAIDPGTDTGVTFGGKETVTIPAGTSMISDEVSFAVGAQHDLAVSLDVKSAPTAITGHPGSRTTSYLQTGHAVSAPTLPEARRTDHWYLLGEVDVVASPATAAVVVIGDSITDGRGSTTNANNRWPDNLAHRLGGESAGRSVAVLNQGIGGNRLLGDGLGPSALARFDRDVLGPCGVRWLIVYEGINDIGSLARARAGHGATGSAEDIIAALRQIAWRAHAHGIRAYGATITPFAGFTMYFTPQSEADRQAVNAWIRTSADFDAVIDFDAAVRDATDPSRLDSACDCGDHLHLSVEGYVRLAAAIDLKLFAP